MSRVAPANDVRNPRPDLDTRDRIEHFVRDFYRAVAQDDLLGPIFAGMHVNWPAHIDKLVDFWSWQLLGERGYEGNPLRAHEPVDRRFPFRTEHFERWLSLFDETVDERYAGPHADLARHRARRMAGALARLLRGEVGPGDAAIEPLIARGRPGAPPASGAGTTHQEGARDAVRQA